MPSDLVAPARQEIVSVLLQPEPVVVLAAVVDCVK